MAARTKTTVVSPLNSGEGRGLMAFDQAGNLIPAGAHQSPQAEFDPGNVGDDILSDVLALAETLAQLGESEDGAKVFVYKIDDKTKKDVFAFETTPSEFATGGLTEIGRRYGGGDFRIRVYSGGRVVTHKRVSIMEPKDAQPIQAPGADINQLQGLFAQQNAAMMEGFKVLAESMRATVPTQQSRADMLQEMLMFKNLFSSQQSATDPATSFTTMMEAFKQGMEMGRGAGEQSSLDVLMKGLEMFGPKLVEAATQGQPQNQPMPFQQQIPVAIPAPVSVPVQTLEGNDVGMMRDAMLKQAVAFLVAQARHGSDPETYANMVLDQLGDEEARVFISRPDWIDFLAQYNPAVKEPVITPWFVELKRIIGELLTGEPEGGISGTHADQPTGTADLNPDGHPTGEAGDN